MWTGTRCCVYGENVRCYRAKFRRPGDRTPGVCTPPSCHIKSVWYQNLEVQHCYYQSPPTDTIRGQLHPAPIPTTLSPRTQFNNSLQFHCQYLKWPFKRFPTTIPLAFLLSRAKYMASLSQPSRFAVNRQLQMQTATLWKTKGPHSASSMWIQFDSPLLDSIIM